MEGAGDLAVKKWEGVDIQSGERRKRSFRKGFRQREGGAGAGTHDVVGPAVCGRGRGRGGPVNGNAADVKTDNEGA